MSDSDRQSINPRRAGSVRQFVEARSWLVGFIPSPNVGCFKILGGADHPFAHCFAMRRDERTGVWTLVEHSIAGLAVEVWNDQQAGAFIQHTMEHGHLLLVASRRREVSLVAPLLQTCTSVIKALLGVRAPWVFTPRGLHRQLVKLGAETISEGP